MGSTASTGPEPPGDPVLNSFIISLLVSISSATAAPLSEGMRGRAWGSAPRDEDKTVCAVEVDDISSSMVRYACGEQIVPGVPDTGTVIYSYLDGQLVTINLYAPDTSGVLCGAVKDLALAAWGPGSPQNQLLTRRTDPWRWVASAGKSGLTHIAALSWSGAECSLLAIDNRTYRKYELLRKEELQRRAVAF